MIRKIIYTLGTALFVFSLAFLVLYATRNWAALKAVQLINPKLLLVSALIYGLSHISSGLSWPIALRQMGQSIPLAVGLRIGLVAQIGKYLPGNLAHYIGRAVIATDSGVSVMTSGVSTAVEVLSALLAAGSVASFALLIDPTPITFVYQKITEATVSVTILTALLLGAAGIMFWISHKGYGLGVLLGPVTCLSISFVLSGASFFAILGVFGIKFSPTAVIAVFAVAWTIGFVVPGAPAGFGVREAILIGFLSPAIGGGAALACAILHRLLTACVDALAAIVGYVWLAFSKKKKSANEVLSRSRTSSG